MEVSGRLMVQSSPPASRIRDKGWFKTSIGQVGLLMSVDSNLMAVAFSSPFLVQIFLGRCLALTQAKVRRDSPVRNEPGTEFVAE